MSITAKGWTWVHETAWESDHVAFATNCSCFSGFELQRFTWIASSGRGPTTRLGTGYHQIGRWILQNNETKELTAAVNLQWDTGLFNAAWLQFYDPHQILTGELNPAFWVIETLVHKLAPDSLVIHGETLIASLKNLGERKQVAVPFRDDIVMQSILRLDRDAWNNYPDAAVTRKDLDWVRRQVARETRSQEFAKKPRRRPLLLRILLALSPMRRSRSETMIHPIDRLKRRLS